MQQGFKYNAMSWCVGVSYVARLKLIVKDVIIYTMISKIQIKLFPLWKIND